MPAPITDRIIPAMLNVMKLANEKTAYETICKNMPSKTKVSPTTKTEYPTTVIMFCIKPNFFISISMPKARNRIGNIMCQNTI